MKLFIFSITIILCILKCLNCQDDFDNVMDYRRMMESLGKLPKISTEAKELSENLLDHLILNRHNNEEKFQPEVFMQNLQDSLVPEKDYNVSDQCISHTLMLAKGLVAKESWAIAMIDSAGKLPSGLFLGNLLWLGTHSQCVDVSASYVSVEANHTIDEAYTGQYCIATINNSTKLDEELEKKNPNAWETPPTGLRIGVCVPDSCSEEDTRALINTGLYFLPKDIEAVSVTCQPKSIPFDAGAIVALLIVIFLAALVIAGTMYDVLVYQPSLVKPSKAPIVEGIVGMEQNGEMTLTTDDKAYLTEKDPETKERENKLYHRLLMSFSFVTNGTKLLSTKQSSESLTVIHGVRFFSMSWVVFGHTYFYTMFSSGFENLVVLPKLVGEWSYQVLSSATLSVDSFFLLSGLLLSYLTLKEMKKRGGPKNMNWPMFYFHRFWRLTPPYMLILGIHTALFAYIGSGPMWPTKGIEPFCHKNWWTNLLYINNLVNPSEACMGWTWYLACDMQFFILSPLFLIPLYMSGLIGTIITCGVMMISFVTTGILAVRYEFSAAPLYQAMTVDNSTGSYFNDLYIVPWTRIGPYLVGILVGYVIYRTERKVKMHWLLALGGWVLAALCCLSTLYGLTGANRGDYENSLIVSAIYLVLARTVWSLGLAWVIFACITGYGGFVNTLLSWSAIVPLSRLTYMAYLVHPVVMYWYYYSREKLIFFQDSTMAYFVIGNLVVSYGVAFIASLSVEAPMMGLEKVFFFKGNSKQGTTGTSKKENIQTEK